jgi:hypothetical protein
MCRHGNEAKSYQFAYYIVYNWTDIVYNCTFSAELIWSKTRYKCGINYPLEYT